VRRALELKFKGKIAMGSPRRIWFSQVVEDFNKREKNRYVTEKERMWKMRTKALCPSTTIKQKML
jgi:hypothetical protein